MRCPVCGKENKSFNHYCESCGAKLGEKSKGPDNKRIITVLIISAIAIMILLEGIYVSSLRQPTIDADTGSSAADSADTGSSVADSADTGSSVADSADAGKSEDVEEKPEQGPDGNVEYSSTRYGIATADDVIIRDQPSREATIIGALSKGEKVLLLDEKYSEDGYKWYHIQLENNNTGYVRGDLITVEGETDSLTEEAGNEPEQGADGLSDSSAWKYGIVATDHVIIRNDASSEAGAIGTLDEGSRVRILDVVYSADGYKWYYIQLDNGNTGYIRGDLITVEGETDSSTEVAGDEGKAHAPFYGIWCGASKDRAGAESFASSMEESGLPADIFVTTDWSNLNKERYYVISAGVYDSKEEAEKMLSRAKKFKSDAYIKYSGEWIGE